MELTIYVDFIASLFILIAALIHILDRRNNGTNKENSKSTM